MGVAQASDYLEIQLVNHLFRTAAFAKPPGLFLALFTAAPSDAGGGTEVTGGAYARVNLPPSDANWAAPGASNGLTSNAVTITFPVPTANWGLVTHFGIFDAATGGNLLVWDVLSVARNIVLGDPGPAFAIGALQVTVQ